MRELTRHLHRTDGLVCQDCRALVRPVSAVNRSSGRCDACVEEALSGPPPVPEDGGLTRR